MVCSFYSAGVMCKKEAGTYVMASSFKKTELWARGTFEVNFWGENPLNKTETHLESLNPALLSSIFLSVLVR